jgi:16S rRNA (cytosine967-C5)-methyltransferase
VKLPGRIAAAIDVLNEVMTRHRPAGDALRDWGKAHRFAGSGDRHAIGTLVYDSLRTKLSSGAQGGGEDARRIVLGCLVREWGVPLDELASLVAGEHGPGALTADEKSGLTQAPDMVGHVAANIPSWLFPAFEKIFGSSAVDEGQALAQRAPIDLRANSLKADQGKVIDALQRFGAVAAPWSPLGIRIPSPGPDQKHVNVEAEPAHGMGWFEVQDVASQIAALISGVKPGERVADICAGAGGKTLALAAMMKNEGQLVAHDKDRHRLRPIFERLLRSGATNVEVLAAESNSKLQPASFDCVVIDAPCTGSGAWRRKPESKWKLTQKTLDQRLVDQQSVLTRGASLVKPGGRLVYITCSVLPSENTDQISTFLKSHTQFEALPFGAAWAESIGGAVPHSADGRTDSLLLTPYQHDTDGFFVCVMQRIRN